VGIIAGELGDWAGQVLGCSLVVAGASIFAIAGFRAWELPAHLRLASGSGFVRVRRISIAVFLVSIGLTALFGMSWIMMGDFGEWADDALVSLATVAGTALLLLAGLNAWNVPTARIASRIAVAGSVPTALLTIASIWIESRPWTLSQSAATAVLLTAAGAYASMLALVRIAPRFYWVRKAAIGCIVPLVTVFVAAMWGIGGESAKWVSVLAVIELGLTLAVSLLGVASRTEVPRVAELRFCPECGESLLLPSGEVMFSHCNVVFSVEAAAIPQLPKAVVRAVSTVD